MAYLIIDLEMSGTEAGFHEIIQVGCVLADDNWNKISEFESLVYPENEDAYSSDAEKIHGISIEDLDEAPMAYEVFENMEKWIRKSLKRTDQESLNDIVLCGQSVINDINFLKLKYDELNLQWSFSFKLIDLFSLSYMFYKIFDTNGIQRPKSYSLSAVAKFFSLNREEETHNALEDAKLTYMCFKKYFEIASKVSISL